MGWAAPHLLSERTSALLKEVDRRGSDALEVLESEVHRRPYAGAPWLMLGLAKRRMGHPEPARADLEHAEALDGPCEALSAEIALTFLDGGDAQAASKRVKPPTESLPPKPQAPEAYARLRATAVWIEACLAIGDKQIPKADKAFKGLVKEIDRFSEVLGDERTFGVLSQVGLQIALAHYPKAWSGHNALKTLPAKARTALGEVLQTLDAIERVSGLSPQALTWGTLKPLMEDPIAKGAIAFILEQKLSAVEDPQARWDLWQQLLYQSGAHRAVRHGVVRTLDTWARGVRDSDPVLAMALWEQASKYDPCNPELPKSVGLVAAKAKDALRYQRSWHRVTWLMESWSSVSEDLKGMRTSAGLHAAFYDALDKAREQGTLREIEDLRAWAVHGYLACLDRQLALHHPAGRLLHPPHQRLKGAALETAFKEVERACRATESLPGTTGSSFRLWILDGTRKKNLTHPAPPRLAALERREQAAVEACRKAWSEFAAHLFNVVMSFWERVRPAPLLDDFVMLARLLRGIPTGLLHGEIRRLIDPKNEHGIEDVSKIFRGNPIHALFNMMNQSGAEGERRLRFTEAAWVIAPDEPQVLVAHSATLCNVSEDFESAFEILTKALEASEARGYDEEEVESLKNLQGQCRGAIIGQTMQPAIKAMQVENWAEALKLLEPLMVRFGEEGTVVFHAALCTLKLGRLEAGRGLAQQAVEVSEGDLLEQALGLVKQAPMIAFEKELSKAGEALGAEQNGEVIRVLGPVVEAAPDLAQAWYFLAVAHFRREDFRACSAAIWEAIHNAPSPEARQQYGEVLGNFGQNHLHVPLQGVAQKMNSEDYFGARDRLVEVCDQHPYNHQAWYYRAICELRCGDHEAAERCIEEAIERGEDPENIFAEPEKFRPKAPSVEGPQLLSLAIPSDLRATAPYHEFKKSLKASYINQEVSRAAEAMNNKNHGAARSILEDLLKGEGSSTSLYGYIPTIPTGGPGSDSDVAHYYLSICLMEEEEFELAQEAIKKAIKLADDRAAREKYEELAEALKTKPIQMAMNKAIGMMNEEDWFGASKVLKKLSESYGEDDHNVFYHLALCEMRADRLSDAERAIDKALKLARKGWPEGPVEQYETLKKNIKDKPVQEKLNKAVEAINKGNHREAERILDPMTRHYSTRDHPQVHYFLALCHFKAESYRDAGRAIDEAIKLDKKESGRWEPRDNYKELKDAIERGPRMKEMEEISRLLERGDYYKARNKLEGMYPKDDIVCFHLGLTYHKEINSALSGGPLSSKYEAERVMDLAMEGLKVMTQVNYDSSPYKESMNQIGRFFGDVYGQLQKAVK